MRACSAGDITVHVVQCGNIIHAAGAAAISCCGVCLPPLEAEEPDEGHRLVRESFDGEYLFTVPHEMRKDHYISFLAYVTTGRFDLVKLYPEGQPGARFYPQGGGSLWGQGDAAAGHHRRPGRVDDVAAHRAHIQRGAQDVGGAVRLSTQRRWTAPIPCGMVCGKGVNVMNSYVTGETIRHLRTQQILPVKALPEQLVGFVRLLRLQGGQGDAAAGHHRRPGRTPRSWKRPGPARPPSAG